MKTAMILDPSGRVIPFWEPRPGYFVPVECNAAVFGGERGETVKVTPEMIQERAAQLFGERK